MRVKILFILLLGSLTSNAFSQEIKTSKNVLIEKNTERDFYIEKQLEIYNYMPSTLGYWQYGDWSTIEFNGSYKDGDFKTVADFSTKRKFSFKTESVLSIPNKKVNFYGNFVYKSEESKEADWNLFYKKEDTGTPFRFITPRTGNWRIKQYGVTGFISKDINERLRLGVGVEYIGDMYFRVLDTRNEQFNLRLKLHTSATYKIKTTSSISLGLIYNRKKTEPKLNNDFKIDPTGFERYITIGLGDFDPQENTLPIYVTDENPEIRLGFYSKSKDTFTTTYSYYPGKEKWKQNITSLSSEESSDMYKYDYSKHNLRVSYLKSNEKRDLLYKLNSRFIKGTGYLHNVIFQRTYLYDEFNCSVEANLFRKNKRFFEQTTTNMFFENTSKKDMFYGQLMKYTNLNFDLKTDAKIIAKTKDKIRLSIMGGYKINLSHTHDLGAASAKKYTINIAHNEMAFNTAHYFKAGSELAWFHRFKNTATRVTLNYSYWAPTNIQIRNNYSLLEESVSKSSIGLSFNLIF